jgi:deoxycytidine triphosphate deaminase
MLLSDRDLLAEVEAGRLALEPWDAALVQPSSVDVRLDRFFRVFNNSQYTHIDPAVQQDDLTSLVEPDGDNPFVLHPGEFVLGSTLEVVTLPDDLAGRLEGKALALDTPVPSPDGWRRMGDLAPGDLVFDEAGAACEVVAATDVLVGRPCRRVTFSDGSSFVADADHQWATITKARRKRGHAIAAVRTTEEIRNSLRVGVEFNHHVPLCGPVQYPTADLPTDPYLLGRSLDEQVPDRYLRADVAQRLALLQGLMDSAGYADVYGRCEFVSIREHLADAVVELAASLGLRPVKQKKRATLNGIDHGPAYQVRFTPRMPVFRLPRKLARLKADNRAHLFRAIVAVDEVASVPVRCIQVSSASGMFLVGHTYVPTHNSSLGRLGLLTHSTAGFIDPGFNGHITLELSNVANLPITLWPGMKIGQLCVFRLSSAAEHPYGSAVYGSRYQGQRGPTPSRSYQNFKRWPTQ